MGAQPQRFADKLNAELEARGWGRRTLARALTGENGAKMESTRRTVNEWLGGYVTPKPESRRRVENVLGLKAGTLDDETEDVAA